MSMIRGKSSNLLRLLTSSLLLGLLLVGLFSNVKQAAASRSVCRTDPIVTLSNGWVVQMISDVEADAPMRSVSYDLHIPSNLSLSSVWYDPLDTLPEVVHVYADNAPGKFSGIASINMKSRKDMGWIKVTVTINNRFTTMMSGDSVRPVRFDFTEGSVQQR